MNEEKQKDNEDIMEVHSQKLSGNADPEQNKETIVELKSEIQRLLSKQLQMRQDIDIASDELKKLQEEADKKEKEQSELISNNKNLMVLYNEQNLALENLKCLFNQGVQKNQNILEELYREQSDNIQHIRFNQKHLNKSDKLHAHLDKVQITEGLNTVQDLLTIKCEDSQVIDFHDRFVQLYQLVDDAISPFLATQETEMKDEGEYEDLQQALDKMSKKCMDQEAELMHLKEEYEMKNSLIVKDVQKLKDYVEEQKGEYEHQISVLKSQITESWHRDANMYQNENNEQRMISNFLPHKTIEEDLNEHNQSSISVHHVPDNDNMQDINYKDKKEFLDLKESIALSEDAIKGKDESSSRMIDWQQFTRYEEQMRLNIEKLQWYEVELGSRNECIDQLRTEINVLTIQLQNVYAATIQRDQFILEQGGENMKLISESESENLNKNKQVLQREFIISAVRTLLNGANVNTSMSEDIFGAEALKEFTCSINHLRHFEVEMNALQIKWQTSEREHEEQSREWEQYTNSLVATIETLKEELAQARMERFFSSERGGKRSERESSSNKEKVSEWQTSSPQCHKDEYNELVKRKKGEQNMIIKKQIEDRMIQLENNLHRKSISDELVSKTSSLINNLKSQLIMQKGSIIKRNDELIEQKKYIETQEDYIRKQNDMIISQKQIITQQEEHVRELREGIQLESARLKETIGEIEAERGKVEQNSKIIHKMEVVLASKEADIAQLISALDKMDALLLKKNSEFNSGQHLQRSSQNQQFQEDEYNEQKERSIESSIKERESLIEDLQKCGPQNQRALIELQDKPNGPDINDESLDIMLSEIQKELESLQSTNPLYQQNEEMLSAPNQQFPVNPEIYGDITGSRTFQQYDQQPGPNEYPKFYNQQNYRSFESLNKDLALQNQRQVNA